MKMCVVSSDSDGSRVRHEPTALKRGV